MKSCQKIYDLIRENPVLVAEHTDVFHIPYPDPVFRGLRNLSLAPVLPGI